MLVVYTVVASLYGAEKHSDFDSDFAIFVSELGEFAAIFAGVSFIWLVVASAVERAKQRSDVPLAWIALTNLCCGVLMFGLQIWALWMMGWRRDWVGGEVLGFVLTLAASVMTIYVLKRQVFSWTGLTFARPALVAILPLVMLVGIPLVGGFLYIVALAAGYQN